MKDLQEMSEITGQFVVAHAEFISRWAEENIPKGSGDIGVGMIAAGIGISAGIFCKKMPGKVKVKSETLKEIIVLQLDKQISRS